MTRSPTRTTQLRDRPAIAPLHGCPNEGWYRGERLRRMIYRMSTMTTNSHDATERPPRYRTAPPRDGHTPPQPIPSTRSRRSLVSVIPRAVFAVARSRPFAHDRERAPTVHHRRNHYRAAPAPQPLPCRSRAATTTVPLPRRNHHRISGSPPESAEPPSTAHHHGSARFDRTRRTLVYGSRTRRQDRARDGRRAHRQR